MKKIALIMMFSVASVVLSGEEYTIQTISAQKETSITPAFEKKVHKSALQSEKKKEGSCNVVTVGHYKSVKEAKADLKKAKAIAKDAFVRPINRPTPKACENTAVDVKTKVVEKKVEQKVGVAPTPVKKEEVVITPQTGAKAPILSSTATPQPSVASNVNEVKEEPCKGKPCGNVTNTVSVHDRNVARKNDIHEAIEYYKNSPYHTFKPIATQR
jgi:hypothetical protein